MEVDLERPFQLKRKFDLVVSLEVAEHRPAHCAEDFVSTLTGLGSVVLFSAAAPHQGGEHHVDGNRRTTGLNFSKGGNTFPLTV
jgi:hypothetical protein